MHHFSLKVIHGQSFQTHTHLLAQKYLIELLMWSASGVHKQSPKVWQAKVGWHGRKNQYRWILSLSWQKATVPSDEIGNNSDCENRTVYWTCWHRRSGEGPDATEKRHAGSWLSRLPLTRNWNGVAGTSPGVPGDILGSYEELRWMEPHMSSPSPCNYNAKLIKHETQPLTKQGSFTSVQMVHTHASLPRGFCSGSQAVKAIIRSLKRKWLQNTGKNHQLN